MFSNEAISSEKKNKTYLSATTLALQCLWVMGSRVYASGIVVG